jgi:hypothetical protein
MVDAVTFGLSLALQGKSLDFKEDNWVRLVISL